MRRKIIFVKENYIGDDLKQIVVRYTDTLGKATAIYNPLCVPKYVQTFMEKRKKEVFSTEYDKKTFGLTVYIYRK